MLPTTCAADIHGPPDQSPQPDPHCTRNTGLDLLGPLCYSLLSAYYCTKAVAGSRVHYGRAPLPKLKEVYGQTRRRRGWHTCEYPVTGCMGNG